MIPNFQRRTVDVERLWHTRGKHIQEDGILKYEIHFRKNFVSYRPLEAGINRRLTPLCPTVH